MLARQRTINGYKKYIKEMETSIAQRNKELANKLKHLDSSSNDLDGNILASLLSKGDADRMPQTIKKVMFYYFLFLFYLIFNFF